MPSARLIVCSLLIALLSGCGSTGHVPVYQAGERRGSNTYIVQRGDTLYSIAFRYGVDYKDLAAANDIDPPYTIYVDQRLKLLPREVPPAAPTVETEPPGDESEVARSEGRPAPTIPTPRVTDSDIEWRWPYEGEIVGAFSLSGKINKGIDIRGKTGDDVRSSADGVVVYAGGGLRGYGKLVIVKHNDRYLSAYGHNQSILVKEGDKVRAGQVVARIGGPNGDKDLLHFEIRKNGKPEDPLAYLPPRST